MQEPGRGKPTQSYLLLLFAQYQTLTVRSKIGCPPLDYVLWGKKKKKERKMQATLKTHGLRTFTNPTWMEIICKRSLWSVSTINLPAFTEAELLKVWIIWVIFQVKFHRGLWVKRVINLGPHTGVRPVVRRLWGWLFPAETSMRAWGLSWKQRPEERRPRGPTAGAGVTLEIWNQLTMAASASSREREQRGEATPWPCGKAASLTISEL